MVILGIETSCDETAASVLKVSGDSGPFVVSDFYASKNCIESTRTLLLSNIIYSQNHAQFGGVVPELASRSHLEKIGLIVEQALVTANVSLDDLTHIAVTTKPGLPGSLLVGMCFAKAIALAKNIPIIGVDHLEGHAFSPLLEHNVPFPHLALTASGGHTNLMLISGLGEYQLLGSTLDDAAGEAFDKIAKLLGLPYPGGPVIEKLAAQEGFVDYYKYPRGNSLTLDFSFSGLKTAVMYDLPNNREPSKVASSLLVCISDIFKRKLSLALQKHPEMKAITFAGGVACNKFIKSQLSELAQTHGIPFFAPSPPVCTDNGAMIAFVGAYKARQGKLSSLENVPARAILVLLCKPTGRIT